MTKRSRTARRVVAALTFLALLFGFGMTQIWAGPRSAPTCWIAGDPLTIYAVDLPTNDTFSLTFSPYPAATHLTTADGTFSTPANQLPPFTVYFWQRGGGKSLLKPGPQLNDYHLIATCST